MWSNLLKSRLFYKVFISGTAILLVIVVALGLLFAHYIKSELVAEVKVDLVAQSQIITLLSKKQLEKHLSSLSDMSKSRITLIDESGWVLADSERNVSELDNHLNRPEVQEARIKGKGEALRYSHTLAVDMLYIVSPIREGSKLTGYVRLARPLYAVKRSVDRLYRFIYQSVLIIFIPSLIIAFFLSRKLVLPIQKIESYTEKASRGEMPGTLLVESTDEMGRLAENINRMVLECKEKIELADEEKGKLEAAFSSMVEGVLILDSHDRIELINKCLKDILGKLYSDQIINITPLEAFRNVELQNAIERFKKTKTPIVQQITIGEENPVILEVSISAVKGLPGGEEKTMLVFHDVTRLKKLEKIREDFVANVTHEIKTPLTAIIGFVETLQGGAIDDKGDAKKFLQTISENARRLDRLVDDLLTLSSIELGEMKMQFEKVSVADILGSVLPVFEVKAVEKSIAIDTNIPEDLPPIRADRDKMIQVLLNILDNAMKFTPDGGQISVTAFQETGAFVTVKISDTGVGIPKSEISRLGERFYRVDKTRSREEGGTGLGLSIVKHLMKAHEGRIIFDSQVGKGTSVSLYFPVSQGKTV
ncbi:MAG: HAMP domain-containing protein [Deltaproteobacteria bacterium]|nr:HAMP domain-containing protein [Deltaproteobacteria bacterium]